MGSGIETQPLEFSDFSGGITDNILQGGPQRYAKADNFFITVDKKLEERHGTVVYDPVGYTLGSGWRVSNLFLGFNESLLFAVSNEHIYSRDPNLYGTAWSKILGPEGSPALDNSDSYVQLTTGEFQKQIYFTSTARNRPGKIYRDQNGAWKAVTAGIPKMEFSPNYPDNVNLIADCITLANLLRNSMISHFGDAGPLGTGQHANIDTYSLSYFSTQSGTVPDPVPTPAPNATDETSLYTLCTALALAYEAHRNDLAGPSPSVLIVGQTAPIGDLNYHQNITVRPLPGGDSTTLGAFGISAKMTRSGVVPTPERAAYFLNELAQKWYWHQLTPYGHFADNDVTKMSRYLIIGDGNDAIKIGPIYRTKYTVQIQPNYDDFVALAKWLKDAFNNHLNGAGSTGATQHSQIDSYGPITLSDPVDFDSSALTIFWLRYLYGALHVGDANLTFLIGEDITFDTISGSANISSVKNHLGAATTLTEGYWICGSTDLFTDSEAKNKKVAQVISSGLGTATLSKAALGNGVGVAGQANKSWVHVYAPSGTFAESPGTPTYPSAEFLGTNNIDLAKIGSDLLTWMDLAESFSLAFGAHLADATSHFTASTLGAEVSGVSAINGNPFFIPSVVSYAWALFYRHQYTVEANGIQYLVEGAPVFSDSIQTMPSYQINDTVASKSSTVYPDTSIVQTNWNAQITGIPALVNTVLTNYDIGTSVTPVPTTRGMTGFDQDFTIEVYRTTDGGTTFYHLDSLINEDQSYQDTLYEPSTTSVEDALNLQPVMYTSGGVVANDPPPKAKVVHQFGGFFFYGNIEESGQLFPQRIRQSKISNPDSCPQTFYEDFEDDVVAISSTKTNLIALCTASLYRVSGSFSTTGQGGMTHEKIADSIGCLCPKSVVRTEVGVFFAGSDGFYYTDGYQLVKISLDLDSTYRAHTQTEEQRSRIYGAYDKLTRRVWWAMQSRPYLADNDVFFVFYLNYGVKPAGVFTKVLTTGSWAPASVSFFNGRLIVGDSRGYLFKTDPLCKTDPKIDLSTVPANWGTLPVPYLYQSCAVDLGTASKHKWVTRIHLVGENVGNAALQIGAVTDMGRGSNSARHYFDLAPVQFRENETWGDPRKAWGDDDDWRYDGVMDIWRRFPSRSLRSDFLQIKMSPGDFVVYRSDDWPEFAFANVNSTAKTATLTTPTGFTSLVWPKDVVDYYISFDTDDYATKFLITNLDGTKKIITFLDSGNVSVTNTTSKWQISGVKREQRVKITTFNLIYGLLGDEFQAYPGNSDPGGQGGNS